ncbi:MAG TPA: precorrin-8X methylmutase [Candidatus Dormibacteraeota bacterium]|jgi:precorrin-8X/cobalt-precorrin-8 methylmutase|nr:precorrin-8X methylmutase [Candidatus Dormibacteraeota bacterium]
MSGAPSLRPGAGRALRAHGLPAAEIMPLSLERLRRRSPVELPPEPAASVALRMAYAAGDPDLLRDIVIGDGAVDAAAAALDRGAPLICDVAMVAAGVRTVMSQRGVQVLCAQDVAGAAMSPALHHDPQTLSAVEYSTRTARGLLNLAPHWDGAVIAIGNAPTALLALLDALADGAPRPAAIIAAPCGLVAAEEAKQLLVDVAPAPYITVRGTRGGSAVAAAAVNACALLGATVDATR